MFLKTQYIQKINGGGGVVFATGTPIANSVAEMFTMQRYLQMALNESKSCTTSIHGRRLSASRSRRWSLRRTARATGSTRALPGSSTCRN
jgi:hypothetical protein